MPESQALVESRMLVIADTTLDYLTQSYQAHRLCFVTLPI